MKLDVALPAGRARGLRLHRRQGVRRALPRVVFVHGALNDHSVWTLLARWFANHGHGVLALDLPGHGRSGGPPLASVEAMADWLLALLDAAGVAARLVGHSMGSLIALEAAARAPSAGARLVMVAHRLPDEGLAGAARRRARRSRWRDRQRQHVLAFDARRQALVSRARAPGCTARTAR